MEDLKIFIPEVKGIGNQDLELAINGKLKKKAVTWLPSIVMSEVKPLQDAYMLPRPKKQPENRALLLYKKVP